MAFSGCTLAITQVQTDGVASDVVDEAQTPHNEVKPELSLPLVGK